MAEEAYFERKKKIAETIVTLSASSDPADQRMAIELGEVLRNMQEKYNPVPEVPVKEIVEEAPADTLGEPYIDRSLGQQAMDFVKEQTTPERAELAGMTLGAIPAWMSMQADALPVGYRHGMHYSVDLGKSSGQTFQNLPVDIHSHHV